MSSIPKDSSQWYACDPVICTDEPGWTRWRYYMRRMQADTLEGTRLRCSNDLPHAHHVSNWLRDWKPPSFPITAGDATLWEAPLRVLERIVYRLQVIWGRQSRGTRTSCWLAVQKGLCGWMRWSSMRFCRCQRNSFLRWSETEFCGVLFNGCDSNSIQGRWFQICTTAKFCLTWLKRVIEEHSH